MPKSLRVPAVVALTLLWGACTSIGPELGQAAPSASTTTATAAPPGDGTLAPPQVAAPAPGRPRYSRDDWQPHGWADADGDGCNTREEVLVAESVTPAQVGPGCKVLAGEWEDRYTGRRLTSPADVQIDHLVSATSTAVDH
jgi:hypothetical protein